MNGLVTVLLVAAFACFAAAAWRKKSLTALGLALWLATALLGRLP